MATSTAEIKNSLRHSAIKLDFDNSFARLPEYFYRRVEPTPLPKPYLVSFNREAAKLIDLDEAVSTSEDFIETFTGNRLMEGSEPLAAIYAGHQFGTFVPQLGDGRAILLGEVRNKQGARWDVQLKGAGRTAFSRFGDGRAVLRSTIREYLCSEAMHCLGIPSTRALCITGSDAPVQRETIETAAVLTRLAPSHVRFGSFEVFHYRDQPERVTELADYVIREFYPQFENEADKYLLLLREVIHRTARLIAKWQSVGWTHGVMNTDNMSILGLTIDYGPYGFMDEFDVNFIPNHSDYTGRYAFNQQPQIGLWNCVCLAYTLLHLMTQEAAQTAIDEYSLVFAGSYGELMRAKLGFETEDESDGQLVSELINLLQTNKVDYTIFFRRLGSLNKDKAETNTTPNAVRDLFADLTSFDEWAARYRRRLHKEHRADEARTAAMNQINPKYLLRNYLAENAIRRARDEHDFSEVNRLLKILQQPFDDQPEMESYAGFAPDWGKHLVISCSS